MASFLLQCSLPLLLSFYRHIVLFVVYRTVKCYRFKAYGKWPWASSMVLWRKMNNKLYHLLYKKVGNSLQWPRSILSMSEFTPFVKTGNTPSTGSSNDESNYFQRLKRVTWTRVIEIFSLSSWPQPAYNLSSAWEGKYQGILGYMKASSA